MSSGGPVNKISDEDKAIEKLKNEIFLKSKHSTNIMLYKFFSCTKKILRSKYIWLKNNNYMILWYDPHDNEIMITQIESENIINK